MKTIIFLFLSLNVFAQSPLLTLFDGAVVPDSLGSDVLEGHGTFTTATDTLFWTKDAGTGVITMTGGKCHFEALSPSGSGIYKLGYAGLTAGKTYRVEITLSNITSGGFFNFYLGTTDFFGIPAITEAGTYVRWNVCAANTNIILGIYAPATLDIDNIKIEEVLP